MTFEEYRIRLGGQIGQIERANLRKDSWDVIEKVRRCGASFQDAAAGTYLDPAKARSPQPEPGQPLSAHARSRKAHNAAEEICLLLDAAARDPDLAPSDPSLLETLVRCSLISSSSD